MSFVALILAGIGIWLLFEGAIYAIAPDFMKQMSARIQQMDAKDIAVSGLLSAGFGVGVLYLAMQLV
jgi:uncharacterized protein YjeT (DUF2065 family)